MLKHNALGSADVFINYLGCGDACGLISGIIMTTSSREQNEHHESYCCTVHFCRITSIINQQLPLHNFHIKQFKNT